MIAAAIKEAGDLLYELRLRAARDWARMILRAAFDTEMDQLRAEVEHARLKLRQLR
jgi:hypothetical protein